MNILRSKCVWAQSYFSNPHETVITECENGFIQTFQVVLSILEQSFNFKKYNLEKTVENRLSVDYSIILQLAGSGERP